MIGYSNSFSYGPDHSQTKPLEIRRKWLPFVLISNGFRQNGCHFVQNKTPLENQTKPTIGMPNVFSIRAPSINPSLPFSGWIRAGSRAVQTDPSSGPRARGSGCWSPGLLLSRQHLHPSQGLRHCCQVSHETSGYRSRTIWQSWWRQSLLVSCCIKWHFVNFK